MKAIALLLVGIVAASGCGKLLGPRATDSGKVGTKRIFVGEGKELASFTKVRSEGSFEVQVTQAAESNVLIEGDENIVKIVNCKVEDGTLVIQTKGSYTTSTPLVVKVSMAKVEGLDLTGSGSISAASLSADSLDLDVAGSGEITVSGKAKSLTGDISGSGQVDASALEAEDAKVEVSGSGSIKVFAQKTLKAEISGSGHVRYKGSAKLDKDINGSGEVTPL